MLFPAEINWRDRVGISLLSLTAAIALAVVLVMPPLAQPLAYHDFADQRGMAGLPNVLDVGSNRAFILVAVLGLEYLRSTPDVFRYPFERIPYLVFFLALAAIGVGSIYYHLAPDNARLFWDRLLMSLGIAAFVSIVIAERWHAWVGLRLLAPLAITGASTVVWWRLSGSLGSENLVPYLVFQGWAILTALLFLAGVQGRYRHGAYPALAVLLYGAALVAEQLDQAIFAMGGLLSGHTLKHLLAALAVYQLLRMLRRRAEDRICDGVAYSRQNWHI
jgi:hypothetical protein